MKLKLIIPLIACLLFVTFSCKSNTSQTTQSVAPVGPVANPAYKGSGGESKETVAEGVAQITSSGQQDAKGRAIQHALRLAVEQVLGSMVKSQTLIENGTLVSDKIYSKSSGYVQKYQEMGITKEGDTIKVVVKAWVVLGDVKNDALALGILQDRVGRPNTMVVVDEKKVTGGEGNISKTLLEEAFGAKQFRIVDQGTIARVLAAKNIQVSEITGVSTDKLSAIAVDADAQLIIKVRVDSSEQDLKSQGGYFPENYKSVRSTITLQAIYAADGTQIATATSTAAGALIDLNSAQNESIKRAINSSKEKFITDILKQWDDMSNNGFEYEITISGVDFMTASDIESALQEKIEGVKFVNNRGFNNNTVTFMVRYSGNNSQLAKMVLSAGKMPVPLTMKSLTSKTIILQKN